MPQRTTVVDSATVGLGCVQFETLREEGKLVWYPGKIFTDPNHSDLDPVEDEGTVVRGVNGATQSSVGKLYASGARSITLYSLAAYRQLLDRA
jgi:hypothetical protein